MRTLGSLSTLFITIASLTAGCATDGADEGPAGPGAGGKGDDPTEEPTPAPRECLATDELVEHARAYLAASDEFFQDTEWNDELATVLPIPSLEGGEDGDEYLVFPGLGYAGATVQMVLYPSNPLEDCDADYPIGVFAGDGIVPVLDSPALEGWLDIEVLSHFECEGLAVRYTFEDGVYVETDEYRTFDACAEE